MYTAISGNHKVNSLIAGRVSPVCRWYRLRPGVMPTHNVVIPGQPSTRPLHTKRCSWSLGMAWARGRPGYGRRDEAARSSVRPRPAGRGHRDGPGEG